MAPTATVPTILRTREQSECNCRAGELSALAGAARTSVDYEEIARLARTLERLAELCQSTAFERESRDLSRPERSVQPLAAVVSLLLALTLAPAAAAQQSGTWEVSGTVNFTPSPHAASHQDGGDDEIDVTGLSGLLADPQTPLAHGNSHAAGEDDPIEISGLGGVLSDPQKVSIEGTVGRLLTFERCGVTDQGFEAITIHDSCYTPAVSTDWTDPDPDHLQAAADQLAARVTGLEGTGPGGIPDEIEDADGDTGCEVERTADSDALVCRTAGVDRLTVAASGASSVLAAGTFPQLTVAGGGPGSSSTDSGQACIGTGGSGQRLCLSYVFESSTATVAPQNNSARLLLGSGNMNTLELRNDANAVFLGGVRLTPVPSPPWACSVAGDNGREYIDDSGARCTCWGGSWVMTTDLSGSGACA